MRIWLTLLSVLLLFPCVNAGAERIDLGTGANGVAVTVEQSNDSRTVINYRLGAFYREPVTIDNQQYYLLDIDKESILLNKAEPALPRICRSIIIPDDARMKINVIASEYVDFPNLPVAPSKGNLPRTINPDDVPYTFGPVYASADWYPGALAELREPYILRDWRGTVVDLNAFQYNPETQTLRVYTSVTVEVVNDGPGEINVLRNSKRAEATVPDFDLIYGRHFLNYNFYQGKYTPVEEHGDMLIITYDDFHQYREPFAAWKRQKGIKTWIVDVSTIGNNGTSIANFISNFYNADSTNLAFVLLVGDNYQVNKPLGSGNSDPVYAKVAGGDNYPDLFIGRFSSESAGDVQTQVARTITYESNPPDGDWFHKGFGLGSNDPGTGQGGEHDWEHEDLIRADLLNFTYTQVDQLYDNLGVTAAQVAAAVNNGRSIGNYTGHGAPTSWSTSGFSNTNVNALVNDNKLPFIISVACNNGEFDSYTCFGEAWLRATNNTTGEPTGAIGFYGSLISQSWSPPMDCQDEVTDLLCAMAKVTYGGLCFNGACKMIDLNGSDGVTEYNAWTIFGDPSVQVWTDTPAPMTVNHDDAILFTLTEFPVQVPGVEGAHCALYANGTLFGTAYTDGSGNAVIPIEGSLPVGSDITLTVTAFNKAPYIAAIPAISPNGPYLVYEDNVVNDAMGGNGNGVIDYGESIALGMEVKNVGPDVAYDLQTTLSTSDPYVTLTDDSEAFGDVAGNFATVYVADAYAFDIAPGTPDGHVMNFLLTMTEAAGDSVWTSNVSLISHAPVMEYAAIDIGDASGNFNGVLDPGETVDFTVTLQNSGSGQADDVAAVITEDDPYISIVDASGYFGAIAASGGSADNEGDVFTVSADPSCPRGYEANFQLEVTAVNGFTSTVNFSVIVGDRVVFFSDDFSFDQGWSGLGGSGEWTIGPATGGAGSDSYGGPDPAVDHSPTPDNGVLGNDLTSGTGGDYNPGLSSIYWVTSPVIDCSDFGGIILSFYRWLGIESNTYDDATLQGFNGTSWVTIFENSAAYDESAWSEQVYDISAIADSNPDFQLRFGIGPTDGSWNYCGWNIDDLTLKGYGERVSAQISMDTDMMADSLIPGDIVEDTIVVTNMSVDAVLRVRFAPDVSWITCVTENQYIDPETSREFVVTVNSAGMDPGDYVGNITCISNDYTNQYDTVQVLLHLYAPQLDVTTAPIDESLSSGNQSSRELVINNTGPGRLEYELGCHMFRKDVQPLLVKVLTTVEPLGTRDADGDKSAATEPYYPAMTRGTGGPDAFGYIWIDSDQPGGPSYSWADISTSGTSVALGDDAFLGPFALGFDFPFYDNSYNEVYIGSNGILTFGAGSTSRINVAIPDAGTPNDIIAMWWDDLDPAEGGHVYYYQDVANNRFVVTFFNIQNYITGGGTGSLSFQAILYPNGQIVLQYATMEPGSDVDGLAGSTIGIENTDGSDGLQVVYNAEYIHGQMAISMAAPRWMTLSPMSGTIEPYSSAMVTVGFDAADMESGVYSGEIVVNTNDPELPSATIPVSLTVASFICGDANGDGDVNVADAVTLINYVFKSGPAPDPLQSGDANGDGDVNVADAVYMINYVFNAGPDPIC